jgi:hypothetical protein
MRACATRINFEPARRSPQRARQELWVRPETAATRIAPSTQPTMPIAEKTKLCQLVKLRVWDR